MNCTTTNTLPLPVAHELPVFFYPHPEGKSWWEVLGHEQPFVAAIDLHNHRHGGSTIPAEAFAGCRTLVEVLFVHGGGHFTTTTNLTRIGYRAFSHCVKLERIHLPEGLVSLGDNAFGGCTALRKINIPSTVIQIASHCFEDCTQLVEVCFRRRNNNNTMHLTHIHGSAFLRCRNLRRMNHFPDTLRELGRKAFQECASLEGALRIPPSVQRIQEECFDGCAALTRIVFEERPPQEDPTTSTVAVAAAESSVSPPPPARRRGHHRRPQRPYLELQALAFARCVQVRSVTLPHHHAVLVSIPSYCFYGCTSLIEVPVPHSVQHIEREAFGDCPKLQLDHNNTNKNKDEEEWSDWIGEIYIVVTRYRYKLVR